MADARYVIRYLDVDDDGHPRPVEEIVPAPKTDGRRGWEAAEEAPGCIKVFSGNKTVVIPLDRLIKIWMEL